jgi:hypothetical protein
VPVRQDGRFDQGAAPSRPYRRADRGSPGADGYYVLDGRHRVSVALAAGRREIDAWVS